MSERVGTVIWINGPVIRARGSRQVGMMELVEVGDEGGGERDDCRERQ